MSNPPFNRRDFLQAAAAGVGGLALAGSASAADTLPKGKAEHCIMLWLGGGQGQIDTWDPKPKGDPKKKIAGGYYDAIDTAIPDVQVCEHLPHSAKMLDEMAILRTVWHDVIDEHGAATNRMHTGRPPSGTIVYPSIGSIISHQLSEVDASVPGYVLIGYPNDSRGPGFLGAQHSFLYLTDTESGPAALSRSLSITEDRQARRERMLEFSRGQFTSQHEKDQMLRDYDTTLAKAARLSGPEFMDVFQLDKEAPRLRQSYGDEFGQRCLLARRLVQSGVRFVEVSHNLNFVNGTGWDVHNDGIVKQHLLIQELDLALTALINDLRAHNLLEKTLIVVSTEFGRPGGFDGGGGRGHHGAAFSTVLAGGGLRTGQVIGQTDEKAEKALDRKVSVPDMFATMLHSLGIDPHHELYDGDRPVPATDQGNPIRELFI